ncbi:hypothetical protein BJV78DRAFT_729791 [Lactifluus subvellereus]|nr:hypothetical protein BJV78DRAFT_729791 [Lactifluus subvellereus]
MECKYDYSKYLYVSWRLCTSCCYSHMVLEPIAVISLLWRFLVTLFCSALRCNRRFSKPVTKGKWIAPPFVALLFFVLERYVSGSSGLKRNCHVGSLINFFFSFVRLGLGLPVLLIMENFLPMKMFKSTWETAQETNFPSVFSGPLLYSTSVILMCTFVYLINDPGVDPSASECIQHAPFAPLSGSLLRSHAIR